MNMDNSLLLREINENLKSIRIIGEALLARIPDKEPVADKAEDTEVVITNGQNEVVGKLSEGKIIKSHITDGLGVTKAINNIDTK